MRNDCFVIKLGRWVDTHPSLEVDTEAPIGSVPTSQERALLYLLQALLELLFVD